MEWEGIISQVYQFPPPKYTTCLPLKDLQSTWNQNNNFHPRNHSWDNPGYHGTIIISSIRPRSSLNLPSTHNAFAALIISIIGAGCNKNPVAVH